MRMSHEPLPGEIGSQWSDAGDLNHSPDEGKHSELLHDGISGWQPEGCGLDHVSGGRKDR
jgi:hypothetical protein